MKHRLITHGGCSSLDGFSSAFIFLKYFCPLYNINAQDIEVIGLNPYDIQEGNFEFEQGDIVLDLPKPETSIFFWCDHHGSNKPTGELPENHYFEEVASCAGLLIDILEKKGVTIPKELREFKKAIDIMDGALYTQEDIKLLHFKQESYDQLSVLQKVHIISAMLHSRDQVLNWELFTTLLRKQLGATPIDCDAFWKLEPMIFYKAQLTSFALWREWADEYLVFNEKSSTIILDSREAKKRVGNFDRFYQYLKFPNAKYGLGIKNVDETISRVGIGCNIFHHEWCKVDIGRLCKEVADKFGEGAGGGHYGVGGATIFAKNADEAKTYILDVLEKRG